ncbi:lysozyme [Sphingobium baderi]|uniref:lysozyme n=1 Tax=Sphingobium baderi TaxID=1332080 RepID=UPI001E295AAC|nr:lysozyme [Sphingobium baderi]
MALIKQYEGCKLKAYKCPAGIWTIGYGRTTNVKSGDTCSQTQADAWLIEEYDAFERQVLALVKVPLAANQLGALVSFTYNLGAQSLKESSLRRLLNEGDYEGAVVQFARWNKAGGKVLNGLVNRRAAETALFRSGI